MKQTRLIMGMPITIEIVDTSALQRDFNDVFTLFKKIDATFSPYKITSEVSRLNRKELMPSDISPEMKEIFELAEQTKKESNGYFDVYRNGILDPSGIVKGWAIKKAADLLKGKGFKNFYVEAGGDIQVAGRSARWEDWAIGIRNPFDYAENVKIIHLSSGAVATSGTTVRGKHIYDPTSGYKAADQILSMTVVADSILNADRFATAAFAMGKKGIRFIESKKDIEGYMIDKEGIATLTTGFEKYASLGDSSGVKPLRLLTHA
jgi:thiamine biosynthesis lipoprotein